MSYLTIKIISIVVLLVILLVVLSNRHGKKDKGTADCNIPDYAFQTWIKQASIYDMQKMLITALVKFDLKYYKYWFDIQDDDVQSKMKILFDTLPKELRCKIYQDESMLSDYIQGCIEENPYLSLGDQTRKRDNVWAYFQHHFADKDLYDDKTYMRIMSDSNIIDDKSDEFHKQQIKAHDNVDEKDNKIDYKAIHDEMYYVEYKLIPHFIEFFNDQPDKATQIVVTIYENLVTLQYHLRQSNPFVFGKVSGEVLGNLDNECLVVFEFPKPFDMPLAKYGAIYINQSQRKFQYWTLEFSFNGKFVLGSKTTEGHSNYGQRGDLSKEEFIHEVCQSIGVDESTLQPRNMICRKNMQDLTDLTLKNAISNYSQLVICLYDCNQPSQALIAMLDQLALEYGSKIVVGLYDVYGGFENTTAAADYNITALPTLLFFKEGKLFNRHIGVCRGEALKNMFDDLLTV